MWRSFVRGHCGDTRLSAPGPFAWPDAFPKHLMTKHCNGRFARGQAMLREKVGDGAIRRALLAQLCNDILCREQILESLRTARRKFFDRLADCGWVKRGHKLKWCGCEPGKEWAARRPRRCGSVEEPVAVRVHGQCALGARLRTWTVPDCGLFADYWCRLPLPAQCLSRSFLCRRHGLIAVVPGGVDWTRMRTARGQGLAATAACPLPVPVRGCAALKVVSDSYLLANLQIHRDGFADAEPCTNKG